MAQNDVSDTLLLRLVLRPTSFGGCGTSRRAAAAHLAWPCPARCWTGRVQPVRPFRLLEIPLYFCLLPPLRRFPGIWPRVWDYGACGPGRPPSVCQAAPGDDGAGKGTREPGRGVWGWGEDGACSLGFWTPSGRPFGEVTPPFSRSRRWGREEVAPETQVSLQAGEVRMGRAVPSQEHGAVAAAGAGLGGWGAGPNHNAPLSAVRPPAAGPAGWPTAAATPPALQSREQPTPRPGS